MNLSKLSDFGILFCVSLSGLVLSVLKTTDFMTYAFLIVFALLIMLMYYAILRKFGNIDIISGKMTRAVYGGYSVLSCAVSAATAAAVMTDTGALTRDYYVPFLILICALAVCFAYSDKKAAANTAGAVTLIICVLLALLAVLCVTKRDFSYVVSGKANFKLLLPLTAFSVCDTVLVLPYIKNKKSVFFTLIPAVYLSALTLVAVSVLGFELFRQTELPLVHLWRSAFITSFLNRFELLSLCAFFVACAVKAGLVLKRGADIFGKKSIPFLTISLFAVAALISVVNNAVYAIAVIGIISGIILPALCAVKNY